MEKSLYEKLNEYSDSNPLRMHMPGHKGRLDSCVDGAALDITEISGFDNLHDAEGILLESMQLASKLWGSSRSFYLVNGSTCGILAGVRTLTKRGDSVLIARNCHKAVYHAVELCGLTPKFLMPPVIDEWQVFGSITPESVQKALSENPEINLVIITSPTYEGVISDIAEISRIVHSHGAKLLVDEAHGAHLGLSSYFEKSSVALGADIVVQSLHKTLCCPTQTAILHASKNVDSDRLSHQLSVFETSSPSYLFLSAVDKFVRNTPWDRTNLSSWTNALEEFYARTVQLSNIEILARTYNDIPDVFAYDKSKIILRCKDNMELAKKLKKEQNVEFEAVSPDFIIAMTGAGDTCETLGKFADILLVADKYAIRFTTDKKTFAYLKPNISLLAEEALEKVRKPVSVRDSIGKICGEYVWKYPPGIPLLIPGEIIPQSFYDVLNNDIYREIHSQSGLLPRSINIIDNQCTKQTQLSAK